MTKQINQKLSKAIDEVHALIDGGDCPETAMIKVASHLLPDQVSRLCQLYNRTATLGVRVYGDTITEKLGEIRTIDPRDILAQCEKRAESAFRAEAKTPKTAALLISASAAPVKKEAAAPAAMPIEKPFTHPTVGLHHNLSGLDLLDKVDEIKSKIASLTAEGESLMSRADMLVASTIQSVRKAASASQWSDDFVSEIKFLCEKDYPKSASFCETIVDSALESAPPHRQEGLRKVASAPPAAWSSRVAQANAHVQSSFQAVCAVADNLPKLANKIASLREELHLIETRREGNRVVNIQPTFEFNTRAEADADHIAKVGAFAETYLANAFRGKSADPAKGLTKTDKYILDLNNPQHEANLSSIRSRRSLQELLVDDPVISSHDDGEVISAYNEISAYSPQVVQNPAVLRAALRQYLQNNASSFDLSQIRNLERSVDRAVA